MGALLVQVVFDNSVNGYSLPHQLVLYASVLFIDKYPEYFVELPKGFELGAKICLSDGHGCCIEQVEMHSVAYRFIGGSIPLQRLIRFSLLYNAWMAGEDNYDPADNPALGSNSIFLALPGDGSDVPESKDNSDG